MQADYLNRVYAGVLGKLIGVYLGRPFEGWTYQRIMEELGPIETYVHERLNQPLVVTDDDVAGTFTFLRALEDHGASPDLTAEQIGQTWLNYIIENRTILWWGGSGNSTEHTAWLNLKKGIPAPASGSIATNGTTVAEQIGAQIFIDGWAMVAPGQPALAARLAGEAGRVSHDGESVYAAQLWAAMEAEAFRSQDIDHLLDTGLALIPQGCLIAKVIADIRAWVKADGDWQKTRDRIEATYGYDKFPGNCHVVPNHALMVMAVLYAPHDFQRAQMIVNTCGWDTDCNAGNVGCLQGIMLGLDALDAGGDFRGPIADRMLISSADGGHSINDAVRVALSIARLGQALAGETPAPAPKAGAQFHFSLPGSVQGFRASAGPGFAPAQVGNREGALALSFQGLGRGLVAAALTPTFSPPEMLRMRTYDLMASPLVYPGQEVRAEVQADAANTGPVEVRLRLRHYDLADQLADLDGPVTTLAPGETAVLTWRLPDTQGQPIAELGLAVTAQALAHGTVLLDRLSWSGAPEMTLCRPEDQARRGEGCDFWRLAWVNAVSLFSKRFPPDFRISQDRGEGMILHGTRDWTDLTVKADVTLHLGTYGGLILRAQGLRRFYAARLTRDGRFQITRTHDDETAILAETAFPTTFEAAVPMTFAVRGETLSATAAGVTLTVRDGTFASGAMGLLIHEGALSTGPIQVAG